MAIVEPSTTGAPLTQGDILTQVTLFATKESWSAKGGEAVKAPGKLCLVLSRPCVAAHKTYLTVAGVARAPDATPKGLDSFEKVLAFLTELRDGGGSPDLFYLGQLPTLQGRYCARLDSLHTVEVPEDPVVRQQFLERQRLGTLQADFVRDLHLRLFHSFASLGFDDNRWFSSEDLRWLVASGEAELAGCESSLLEKQAQKASYQAEGKQFADRDLEHLAVKVANLCDRIRPYRSELHRRQGS